MGWKSTIDMTRIEMEDAVKNLYDFTEHLSNEQLSEILEILMGGEEHGHNYRVVPDGYVRGT